ncbi:paraneoplastic antigen Ma2 homolog [Pseudophryne corroboree]|uniref:paraneoplastic antigen Ma2 homolog n=1 Tax=Pseudophryne corroboree TaxID=495146 RepID=UPI003081543C
MELITDIDIGRWCSEKGVDPRNCFGLRGNMVTVTDEGLLKTVRNLCGVKLPCIIDKWTGPYGDASAVLIKNGNPLDRTLIPSMILLEGTMGRKVQLVWPEERNDEDAAEVAQEEVMEGPSMGEPMSGGCFPATVQGGDPSHSTTKGLSDNPVDKVVDKVVSHLEKWHYEGGYRRLRIFSGIMPVPAGEETYEMWREAAIQHSEEWQCPEHIRRQRVVESLRGPAMGVIQATRRSNPTATLRDYIEALDFSFGTLEDVGDLLARLNGTYQEYGETLTHYIYRVDRLIYKIVDKGGLSPEIVNERRLKQVLKGALTNNPVAQRLRCTMSSALPPNLTDLVKEVKLEEVQIENREKSVRKVKLVLPSADNPSPNIDDRLLKLIEEQNKKIDLLIALQTPQQPITTSRTSGWGRGINRRGGPRTNIECYSCGQLGHRSFECPLNRYDTRGSNPNRRRESLEENENGSPVDPSQAPRS